jgi:dephospho-CoA kinase
MALVIGLTGSIASGKSTVSAMFHTLNIPVIDADKIAREVVEPNEKAYQEIVKEFGREVLFPDNTLDRKKLGSIIFSNDEKRQRLNAIVHPAVRNRMLEQKEALIVQGENCIVMDIPLLFESKLTHLVDKVLVVYVDESVQLHRLMARDESRAEDALERIKSQIPVKEKTKLANAVIDNNGTQDESFEQLKEILREWNVF